MHLWVRSFYITLAFSYLSLSNVEVSILYSLLLISFFCPYAHKEEKTGVNSVSWEGNWWKGWLSTNSIVWRVTLKTSS